MFNNVLKGSIHIILFTLLLSAQSLYAQLTAPSLILPLNGTVTTDTFTTFSWNTVAGVGVVYDLQVATDVTFSTIIHSPTNLSVTSEPLAGLTVGTDYYWRVRANDGSPGPWSNINLLKVFDPPSLGGMQMWLRADRGIVQNGSGHVTKWLDQSGNDYHASQADTTVAPKLDLEPSINNHPVVDFDGSNDFMPFDSAIDFRTIFVVLDWDVSGTNFSYQASIVGGQNCCGMTNQQTYMRSGSGTTNLFFRSTTIDVNVSNGISFAPINRYKIVKGTRSSLDPNVFLQFARDRGGSDVWPGGFAEMLIFDRVLSVAECGLVEDYLAYRYAPSASLGPDVAVDYGYCETDLNAGDGYLTYSWSTGGTDSTISVNQSAEYSVTVENLFGFVSSDTVNVAYPVPVLPTDTFFCQGDDLLLSTGLGSDYNYQWSNGDLTEVATIDQPGQYSVLITDTSVSACSLQSDTFTVTVDTFANGVSLGPDIAFCAGNSIGLVSGAGGVDTYLWSTGDISPTITIPSQGNYDVLVTSAQGCTARDTIFVTINGTAPTVAFTADTVCSGLPTTFTDGSTPPGGDVITNWFWDFGTGNTGDTSIAANPSFTYAVGGVYTVSLTVTTDKSCQATFTQDVLVYENPTAFFQDSVTCIGLTKLFTDASTVGVGDNITSWAWDFGTGNPADTSSQQNPSFTYSSLGAYPASLAITTQNGCMHTFTRTFSVLAPQPPTAPAILVSPVDNFLTAAPAIDFVWSVVSGAFEYRVELSNDPAFGSTVTSQSTTGIMANLPTAGLNDTAYWRVVAINLCGDETPSAPRRIIEFSQNLISGMEVWYMGDQGVVVNGNGKVTEWQDMSGNGNDAHPSDTSFAPTVVVEPSINNMPVLNFDGIDDFLPIDDPVDMRTYFVLLNWNNGDVTFSYEAAIIGGQPGMTGQQTPLRSGSGTQTLFFRSTDREINAVNTLVFAPLERYKIVKSTKFSLDVQKDFQLAKELSSSDVWPGGFAEVMVFDRVLTTTECDLVYEYLNFKYAPPVNLGPDIAVPYGYCDTTLDASPRYLTYDWSTSATGTSTEAVGQTDEYSVSVTNIFGFPSSDTVNVAYPVPDLPTDTFYCLGNTLDLATGLGADYNYAWTNGDVTQVATFTAPGDYSVLITDTNACSLQSDTFTVELDTFAATISLGPDITFCAGNSIGLVSGAGGATSYLWSTTDTTPTISIPTQGTYDVQVENFRECVARDTIFVTIQGVAPTADFEADTVCAGLVTPFTDLSVPPGGDVITDWFWDFGTGSPGDTSIVEDPNNFDFPGSGTYNVSLTVTTDKDCDRTITKAVEVYENPTAFFEDSVTCINLAYQFMDGSTVAAGDAIVSWFWDFGTANPADTSADVNPTFTYTTLGSYTVTLTVTTTNGCTNIYSRTFEVLPSQPFPDTAVLVSPTDGFLTASDSIEFQWNAATGAVKYRVEVADDATFSNLLASQGGISGNTATLATASFTDTTYWRVVAINVCDDETPSSSWTIIRFTNQLISGMQLWLMGDKGVVLNGSSLVTEWQDQSGNNKHARPPSIAEAPTVVVEPSINNKPVVNFDGIDDFMPIDSLIDMRTMIVLLNWNNGDTVFSYEAPILAAQVGGSTASTYLRSQPNGDILLFKSTGVEMNRVDTLDFRPFNRYKIVQGVRFPVDGQVSLQLGKERNFTEVWPGGFAEVMLFDRTLSTSELDLIYTYLRNKYAPPVNLGPDIVVDYGYCDTMLDAESRFLTYDWSTNDTIVSTISVGDNDEYKVSVTDIFGFPSSDSVNVTYPAPFIPQDTFFCLGSTLTLSAGLGPDYNYDWSTGATTESVVITNQDIFSVITTDTFGCIGDSAFVTVDEDSFQATASLGPDVSLCAGEAIALVSGAAEADDYLWSDLSDDSLLVIQNSGTYSVTVTNTNGCEARDTIEVTKKGQQPLVAFTVTEACLGSDSRFLDQSQAVNPDALAAWAWDFGDNAGTDTSQFTSYVYGSTGTYNATLTVTTDSGCTASLTQSVTVNPLPLPLFVNEAPCARSDVKFTDASSSLFNDPIITWNWDFGDGNSSGDKNPTHEYDSLGFYDVTLTVTTVDGCSDSYTETIEVFPAIDAAIGVDRLCIGADSTRFTDASPGFSNIDWFWDFGDGDISIKQNPKHIYDLADTFVVSLTVTNALGCVDMVKDTISLSNPPVVDFDQTEACIDVPFRFTDASVPAAGDTIKSWSWDFDNGETSNNANPFTEFNTAQTFFVSLEIETFNGCVKSVTKPVSIVDPPVADFSFDPDFGSAPLGVQFTDETPGGATYIWDFGDGSATDTAANPVHTYTANGEYTITLIAFNSAGCPDTTERTINVNLATLDLAVEDMLVDQELLTDGTCRLTMQAVVRNMGTRNVKTFDIQATLANGVSVIETWEGDVSLSSGAAMTYTFTANFITDGDSKDFLCIETVMPNGEQDENPTNDRLCQNLKEDRIKIGLPYPNPADEQVTLDIILARDNDLEVELYDALGKQIGEVFKGRADAGLNSYTIDMRPTASGTYIFLVRFQDEEYTVQFIRE